METPLGDHGHAPTLTQADSLDCILRQIAALNDGHVTLMGFTTGWKCMPCTPDLDSGQGRDDIWQLRRYATGYGAALACLREEQQRRREEHPA